MCSFLVLHDFEPLRKTISDLSVCMHDSMIISCSPMTVMQCDIGRSNWGKNASATGQGFYLERHALHKILADAKLWSQSALRVSCQQRERQINYLTSWQVCDIKHLVCKEVATEPPRLWGHVYSHQSFALRSTWSRDLLVWENQSSPFGSQDIKGFDNVWHERWISMNVLYCIYMYPLVI